MQSGCVFWVCEAEWGSEKFLPSTLHAFLCAARGMLQLFGSCRHVTLIFAAACLLAAAAVAVCGVGGAGTAV